MTIGTLASSVEVTKDAFHRGAFHLVQPARGAHRAGIDAMLLAACVPDAGAMTIADFGAGAGAAGLAVASRCKQAHVTLIERDPVMLDCAAQTLALEENSLFAGRVGLADADVETLGSSTGADELAANHFDWVIMNPPFNEPADRASPHETRASAHVMGDALFDTWLKKAATMLHAKGHMALIARPSSLAAILNACDRRFGGLRVVPVYPRQGDAAIRMLVIGQKANRQRLSLEAGLTLHEDDGFTARADALINGLAVL